ncbi:MAG: hypothetical protein K9G58_09905 [Bacteroidales bacterium]|nr:hypothetical protein [Bacteroidales bacterium]MCF8388535.1 hypothetical protein [Bacteroidales bacterium]MCF8398473.1 hypothetical protein [Bacteroidales bacterium]
MIRKSYTSILSIVFTIFSFGILNAQSIQDEIQGIDNSKPTVTSSSQRGTNDIPDGGYLLIPESTNDRVMAFDPVTGDLVDADFIPSDVTNLATPIQAIMNHNGTGILVSDQLSDGVYEYDLDGNFVGIFAPAGGVNTTMLDNARGICLRPKWNFQ